MNQDRQAIETALTRLYQRINMPTATDAAALRIARKIVNKYIPDSGAETEVEPVPAHPLEGLSQREVRELVEAGEFDAQAALDYELAQESPRKTITPWLEEFIAAQASEKEQVAE